MKGFERSQKFEWCEKRIDEVDAGCAMVGMRRGEGAGRIMSCKEDESSSENSRATAVQDMEDGDNGRQAEGWLKQQESRG